MVCYSKNKKNGLFEKVSERELSESLDPSWLIWVNEFDNIDMLFRVPQKEDGTEITKEMELVGLRIKED